MTNNVQILIAAHKKFPMPKAKGYIPILVGARKNYKPNIPYQRDDEGENISEKNPNYNELTAIYWAWKNLKNVEAIGLVHYRRFFFESRPYNLNNVINVEKVHQLLVKYDVLLPKKRNYYIETNYSHYIHAHHKEPLNETRKIIEKSYPAYLNSFDKVMHSRKAHMFNMFIMKRDSFDSYCSFMFGVLNKLEKKIDISEYTVQEARVYGYISELLMDVWLYTTKESYEEIAWGQLGSKHFVKKAISFLNRKYGIGKKQTHF